MRVGINGMGRIGRLALRAALGGVLREEGDPRAVMRQAATDQADTRPVREAAKAAVAQLDARNARSVVTALRRAISDAVRDAATRGQRGAPGFPDGPSNSRSAAAKGGMAGYDQRDAEGAARNRMVRDGRRMPPPPMMQTSPLRTRP